MPPPVTPTTPIPVPTPPQTEPPKAPEAPPVDSTPVVVPTPAPTPPAPVVDPLAGLVPTNSLNLGKLEPGAMINREVVAPVIIRFSTDFGAVVNTTRANTYRPSVGQPVLVVGAIQGMNQVLRYGSGDVSIGVSTDTMKPQKFVLSVTANHA